MANGLNLIQTVDLTKKRNVFVVGDIHGHVTLLLETLYKAGFNPEHDHVLGVGDLVDRGPESHRADWLLSQGWFNASLGNHELMLIDNRLCQAQHLMTMNGAGWFIELSQDKRDHFIQMFVRHMPLLLEALLPNGKKIGLCHATYPGDDWDYAKDLARAYPDQILWDRTYIANRLQNKKLLGDDAVPHFVKNIDHVYYGHTPIKEVLTSGNQSWIDTGGWHKTGVFTVIQVA